MIGRPRRPGAKLALLLVILAAAATIAGCSSDAATTAPIGTGSIDAPASGEPASPTDVVPASPVDGVLTGIQSAGLTQVTGFSLRLDDGRVLSFTIGVLENGAQFPPGHLAEHLATSARVRVFFRVVGADLVVYRLEDAP